MADDRAGIGRMCQAYHHAEASVLAQLGLDRDAVAAAKETCVCGELLGAHDPFSGHYPMSAFDFAILEAEGFEVVTYG